MWRAMLGRTAAAGGPHSFAPLLGASSRQIEAADATPASLASAAASSAAAATSTPWRENELMAWAAASPTRLLRLQRVLQVDALAATQPDSDRIEAVFARYDADGSGRVDPSELGVMLEALVGRDGAAAASERVMGTFDADASGDLSLAEFSRFVGQAVEQQTRAPWPPTVVLHARDDSTVPVASAREFVEALQALGAAADLKYREFERAGHGEIMVELMSPKPVAELRPIAAEFVRECS